MVEDFRIFEVKQFLSFFRLQTLQGSLHFFKKLFKKRERGKEKRKRVTLVKVTLFHASYHLVGDYYSTTACPEGFYSIEND